MKHKEELNSPKINKNDRLTLMLLGYSWDQSEQVYESMKDQQKVKPPTEKDMIKSWILSKDQEQQQMQSGGKIYDDGGWWDRQLKTSKDVYNTAFDKDNWFNTSSSLYSNALGIVGDVANAVNGINYDNVTALQNQAAAQPVSYGSTNQRLDNYNNIQFLGDVSLSDVNGMSNAEGWLNIGKGGLNGALAGGKIFGPIGAAAGFIVGAGANAIGWGINRHNANQAIKYNNTINQNINDGKINQVDYADNMANKLDVKSQMITAKCGGKLKTHKKASGGFVNTASNDYPQQLTEFNKGGNHEDNPNGGVQQGINPQDGAPNLVEEGETKWNNYIFSKRIYADGGTLKALNIDQKYVDKSYSDISKEMFAYLRERPNDPIEKRTFEDNIKKLQMAQEAQKLKAKEKKIGGFLNSLSNEQVNALQEQMMYEAEQQAQMQEQAEQQRQEQAAQQDQAYQDELYGQAAQQGLIDENGIYQRGGHIAQNGTQLHIGKWYSNDTYPEGTTYSGLSPLDQASFNDYYNSLEEFNNPLPLIEEPYGVKYNPNTRKTITPNTNNTTYDKNNWLTYLRFAPVIGSGLNYLKDAFGIQNKPDYSEANLSQNQIDNIGLVQVPHIGGYEKVQPADTAYLENAARAQAAAAMRAAANASNGNRGYVSVNNAVQQYNLLNQLGSLGLAAEQQNTKDRLAVAQYNNAINQINMNADLSVAEKNAAIQQAKAQYYSSLAQMRQQERYANEVARANNEDNFYGNIGQVGKEIMNMRLANSNLGLYYGIDMSGNIFYKPAYWSLKPEERAKLNESANNLGIVVSSKCGGKIKTKKGK